MSSNRRIAAFVFSALAFGFTFLANAQGEEYWVYFGTSTDKPTEEMKEAGIPQSEGIYVGRFDSETGRTRDVSLALKAKSSGYLATTPSKGDRLWFVGTLDGTDGWANAYSCAIDSETGRLSVLNGMSTTGQGVCHTSVRDDARYLTAANYSSGDFTVFSLDSNGGIEKVTAKYEGNGNGPNKRRQSQPYGHSSYFVETDGVQRVFMSDLGSDRIYIARLDEATGALTPDPVVDHLAPPAGSGPRHLAFGVDAKGRQLVFSIDELSSTVSAFRVNFNAKDGETPAERLGTWTTIEEKYREKLTDEESLVDGKEYLYGNKTAAIEVVELPNGKRVLYASNRGQNSVVVFDADQIFAGKEGADLPILQRISTNGRFPRFFMVDPSRNWLLVSNKKSGTVYAYKIDQETGLLTLSDDEPTKLAWVIGGAFAPVGK